MAHNLTKLREENATLKEQLGQLQVAQHAHEQQQIECEQLKTENEQLRVRNRVLQSANIALKAECETHV